MVVSGLSIKLAIGAGFRSDGPRRRRRFVSSFHWIVPVRAVISQVFAWAGVEKCPPVMQRNESGWMPGAKRDRALVSVPLGSLRPVPAQRCGEAVLEGNARFVSELAAGAGDVGTGKAHVAGARRAVLGTQVRAELAVQCREQFQQV